MLRFWELKPSPNNTKVRMALRLKGIDFDVVAVDPSERSALVEATGQELSPAIEDRGIVLNDSEAILQYLDANYRDTPRLFPADRAGRNKCDAWKRELDERIVPTFIPVFGFTIGRKDSLDPAARDGFEELLFSLDGKLAGGEDFGGVKATVNDLIDRLIGGAPGDVGTDDVEPVGPDVFGDRDDRRVVALVRPLAHARIARTVDSDVTVKLVVQIGCVLELRVLHVVPVPETRLFE